MPDQQWEKLKEIFHAAVALQLNERETYLDKMCDGDQSLRAAVESLLRTHEETGNFVDTPAYQAAAEMLVDGGEPKAGEMITHYRVVSLLGEGGMGKVYLAEDTKLHRRVAIKFFPSGLIGNDQANERLLREAQAAAKLDHPNICAVHEVGETDSRCFIVMPYVEGETLDVRMKRKPLELSEALTTAAQVADALADAHAKGIIHRDIKPSNIIVTLRGQAKVMDFGLAKWSQPRTAASLHSDPEASTQALLTTPGTIIGTVPYMSPEQVHGQRLDVRTDIFSFGVVLYEMLTGKQPFASESPAGTISAILTRDPPSVSEYLRSCPSELVRIVTQCLAKDRERRYQAMRDVTTELEILRRACDSGTAAVVPLSVRRTESISVAPTSKSGSRADFLRSWRGFALAAVLLSAALASIYLMFLKSVRSTPISGPTFVNSPAYDYYVRGKVNAGSENRENNENAIKLLEQAIAADPNFAPAYAKLAEAYSIKAFYFASGAEKKKLNENAEVAVEKALALNPDLAEGHSARGLLLWTHEYRFPHEQAIQSYKRALSLNPNLDDAHHRLAVVYFHIGLLDKGWEEIEKALAINPANTLARFRFGVINMYRAKYEEALDLFKTIPHEANPSLVDRQMATALFQLGRTQESSEVVEGYFRTYQTDEGGTVTSVKAMLLAKAGREREMEATIRQAVEIGKGYGHFHHTAYNIASAYSLMNKPDQAIKWLQNAADDGFPCYPLFENDANLDSLRKDERFITFMAKLKRQWEKYNATL